MTEQAKKLYSADIGSGRRVIKEEGPEAGDKSVSNNTGRSELAEELIGFNNYHPLLTHKHISFVFFIRKITSPNFINLTEKAKVPHL